MTRAATPENEAHLLQVARHGTAQHVEKLVRKFARASRLADGKPACAADKYQVIVHIEADRTAYVSAETSAQRRCTLESDACHFPLAATTARRLACDATLVTVLEDSAGLDANTA